jgi:hypothetical protein
MEKLLKIAEFKELEEQVNLGEMSYSKMVETINMKHLQALTELRYNLNKEKRFTEAEIEQLQSKVHAITGDGEVMQLFNQLLGIAAN